MYKVAIITLSDRAFNNIYEDESGPIIKKIMEENNFLVSNLILIDDNFVKLKDNLIALSNEVDLIITTGGTGLTSSDITVDVVENIIEYEIRGMSVALHQFNLSKSTGAMFSRALCGVYNKTMIITLPGSKKAVSEICEYFVKHLNHGLDHLMNVKVH